jgi:hypothetical protein
MACVVIYSCVFRFWFTNLLLNSEICSTCLPGILAAYYSYTFVSHATKALSLLKNKKIFYIFTYKYPCFQADPNKYNNNI